MDYVPTIPESLASRLRWFDGFHVSAELKGNPILDNLLARYSEQTGSLIVPCEWYSPSEFEQKFGIRYSKFASDGNRDRPWVETYVMDLLNRALQKKVSDIHITYMGPYAQVYFRRMGLLQEDEPLNGEEGKALIRGIFQGVFSRPKAASPSSSGMMGASRTESSCLKDSSPFVCIPSPFRVRSFPRPASPSPCVCSTTQRPPRDR